MNIRVTFLAYIIPTSLLVLNIQQHMIYFMHIQARISTTIYIYIYKKKETRGSPEQTIIKRWQLYISWSFFFLHNTVDDLLIMLLHLKCKQILPWDKESLINSINFYFWNGGSFGWSLDQSNTFFEKGPAKYYSSQVWFKLVH